MTQRIQKLMRGKTDGGARGRGERKGKGGREEGEDEGRVCKVPERGGAKPTGGTEGVWWHLMEEKG